MFRKRISVLVLAGLALSLSGCSVDLTGTASTAIQSVFNTLFASVTASLVNGLIPLPG